MHQDPAAKHRVKHLGAEGQMLPIGNRSGPIDTRSIDTEAVLDH
jgi:hypothetical protein